METKPYLHLSPASTGLTRDFLWVNPTPATHVCLTGHVSDGKLVVSHILRGILLLYICVCLLEHRLVNRCVSAVGLHTCVMSGWVSVRVPQDTCSKHNSHPPLWDGAGVNHCFFLSPLLYDPRSSRNSPCAWVKIPAHLISACPLWQDERWMSAGWRNVTGNVEESDWHGKTSVRGFKASRQKGLQRDTSNMENNENGKSGMQKKDMKKMSKRESSIKILLLL